MYYTKFSAFVKENKIYNLVPKYDGRDDINGILGRTEAKSALEMARRLLCRPTSRQEDNIKMDLKGIVYDCVERIHLAQDMDQWPALVNTVMNHQVP
jgi:hypothetical protein